MTSPKPAHETIPNWPPSNWNGGRDQIGIGGRLHRNPHIKGGSGKTTVATNLAVMRSAVGQDLLLIDADDQETASDFTILRNERVPGGAGYTSIKLTGPAVRTETMRLAGKYADIIIDTGGRDTTSQRAALSVAHILLVPFVPRSFDVWTLEKVGALVGRCGRPIRNWSPMPS